MRAFLFLLCLTVQTAFAAANTTQEQMREYAYAGDYESLERALAEAHQESLVGELEYVDLRGLVVSITTSHPTILATTEDWLEAYPNSPYANALRAFQYRQLAWDARDEHLARNTPTAALAAFRYLHDKAQIHAQRAYDAAPDYLPASDAIFRLQMVTKYHTREYILSVLSEVMEETPNLGSLLRAADMASSRWGGAGWIDVAYLCEQYADQVGDPTYDVDICITHITFAQGSSLDDMAYALGRLGDKDHEMVARARAWVTTTAVNRWRTEEEELIVQNYLRGPGSSDVQIASRYLQSFPRSEEMMELILQVAAEVTEYARAEIQHDPFDPVLLEILLGHPWALQSHHYPDALDHTDPNWSILQARLAVARPFVAHQWQMAAIVLADHPDPAISALADQFYRVTIALSDHDKETMLGFLLYKVRSYIWHDSEIPRGDEATLCEIVRLDRLVFDNCASNGLGTGVCRREPELRPQYADILYEAEALGICETERNALYENLGYQGMRIDSEPLLRPIVWN